MPEVCTHLRAVNGGRYIWNDHLSLWWALYKKKEGLTNKFCQRINQTPKSGVRGGGAPAKEAGGLNAPEFQGDRHFFNHGRNQNSPFRAFGCFSFYPV